MFVGEQTRNCSRKSPRSLRILFAISENRRSLFASKNGCSLQTHVQCCQIFYRQIFSSTNIFPLSFLASRHSITFVLVFDCPTLCVHVASTRGCKKKSRKCKNSSCLIFDVHLSIFLFSWQVQRSRTHVHIGVQLGQLTHISNTIILYRQYSMLYTGCSGNPLQPIPRLHIAYISSCECKVTPWLAVA